jgi:hypothetical protein
MRYRNLLFADRRSEGRHTMSSNHGGTIRGRVSRAALAVATATAVVGLGLSVPAASAIEYDSLGAWVTDTAGAPVRQAGAHPDVRFRFTLPKHDSGDPVSFPAEAPHQMIVDLPPGLVGNATAADTCSETMMKAGPSGNNALCPIAAQVGIAYVLNAERDTATSLPAPIYNLERPVGAPAVFAFNTIGSVVRMTPSVRPGDFGITVDSGDISQGIPVHGADITLWGVPADPSHDPQRYAELFSSGIITPPAKTQAPRRPFLTTATSCPGVPEVTTARLDGWDSIGQFATGSFTSDFDDVPFTLTGCDRLAFDPTVDVKTTTAKADAPTGINVDLKVPQSSAPDGLATAHVKDVTVTLPEGLSVSPGSAAGLAACTDAQVGLDSSAVEQCPQASKIGTVEVITPLLEDPLAGSVYVGSQESDDPQSGKMFRIFIVAEGSGVRIKLEGAVKADPSTGQLTSTFVNNPQLPFSELRVKFYSGPGAALATPAACGTHTTNTGLTSWSGKAAGNSSPFEVACREGLGGFAPAFTAGSVSPVAGGFSPFTVAVTKPDGQSAIDGLSVDMPKGVLAKIKGNLGTQVGSVTAFAGSGSSPFPLPGRVFLEGAYGDAPYSLRVVVPAKAGPYDLGEVVVRQKVYVDRTTAQVRVVSDPIPTIVKGVPARLQRLDVNVDKPGFMVNPTSCESKEIKATLHSQAGQTAPINTRFQVGSCGDLSFKPSIALALAGKNQKTTGKHPGVRAKVRQTAGQAGIGQAKVTLPPSLALDPDNAQALCEYVDGTKPDLENHCPKGSIVGRAKATTPLLERALTGDVYFVKNVRKDPKTGNTIRTLPMIVVALRGEIAINLKGESSTTKAGRLVNTFANVPDAPISQFNLNIKGGKTGILAVTRTRKSKINLCARPNSHRAAVDLDGHNGKNTDFATTVKTPCKTKAAKRAKKTRKK